MIQTSISDLERQKQVLDEKMKTVKGALNRNSSLQTAEGQIVKETILKIIEKLLTTFPNIAVDLLATRLPSVTFASTKKYVDTQTSDYDFISNQIRIPKDGSYDFENIVCQELIKMAVIRNKRNNAVSTNDVPLSVIDNGMTQMIANYLVGNDSEKEPNLEERHICNMMDQICEGKLLDAFLKDDVQKMKQLVTENHLVYANQLAVNDQRTKRLKQPSHLALIQEECVKVAKNNGKHIQSNLVGNEYLGRPMPGITKFSVTTQTVVSYEQNETLGKTR